MKLIVGLGNLGKEYENTRHNSGFRVVDAFVDDIGIDFNKNDFDGTYARFKLDDEDVFVFKPLTYMNLSGTAVQKIVHFYKINPDDIVVVYDDLAIKPGEIRLRLDGSSGGQKGMQNIIDNLGTQKIKRIRIGIGEPKFDTIDYVLGKPDKEDAPKIDKAIERAVKALKEYLNNDFQNAMSKYNGGDNVCLKNS